MVEGFYTVSEEKDLIPLKHYVIISRDGIPLFPKVHLWYIYWIKLKCLINFYIFGRKILCFKGISTVDYS